MPSSHSEPNDARAAGPGQAEKPRRVNIQIAPEGGVFMTTRHTFKIHFRHVNCADYTKSAPGTPEADSSDASLPADCSCIVPVDMISPEAAAETAGGRKTQQWLQVCAGGCSEETGGEYGVGVVVKDAYISTDVINEIVNERAQQICDAGHPQGAQVIEVVGTRIKWSTRSKEAPLPAYLSLNKKGLVPHSSALTSGHLALIAARGAIADIIQVDFRSYDFQQHVDDADAVSQGKENRTGIISRVDGFIRRRTGEGLI